LTITATIDKPWHLYSQTTPDNGAQPTEFTFKTNPLLILTGIPKEVGKMVQKHEEVFNADVKYFEGTVQFVQTVKLKSAVKTNISGTVKYMICNDNMCLPPKKVSFDLKLQ
ncbi:MAG TPA: protein-disulfide reductase DsbD family protein, partial [Chitinophagaceae bacterium]|nr:protein-disulfide reductase DsbD family protein [Chitinophagaceae bacterium]